MNPEKRQMGGENGKRGSRYEDIYTLYRLIEFAPDVLLNSTVVQFKEQAGCAVDDLLIVSVSGEHYHQIKADKSITWGRSNSKMKKEFRAQKQECEKGNIPFRLFVVVSEQKRFDSLDRHLPKFLRACTEVVYFPEMTKPSELLLRPELIADKLTQISVSIFQPSNEFRSLVLAIYSAWLDYPQTQNDFVQLNDILTLVRQSGCGKLRCDWVKPVNWETAERILSRIDGLRWETNRGYFEWEYKGIDWGIFEKPCSDASFQRFLGRLLASRPTTFAEFGELLP